MGIFDSNKTLFARCTGLSSDGVGVARIEDPQARENGMKVFVEDMLPGETARVRITKKEDRMAYAVKEQVCSSSEQRCTPVCPEFLRCGGCQIQHADYSLQLEMKEKMVSSCLIRLGKFPEKEILSCMEPILGAKEPLRYRNHVQYPVEYSLTKRCVNIGLFEKKSHKIVEHETCYLVHPASEVVRKVAQVFFSDLSRMDIAKELRQIAVRIGFQSKEMMIIFVTRKAVEIDAGAFAEECVSALEKAGIGMRLTSIWQQENPDPSKRKDPQARWTNLWGEPYIHEILGNRVFRISPDAFFQVNSKQAVVLYQKVKEYLRFDGVLPRVLLDLYCGTGSIGIFCADACHHLIGIESVESAVIDAKANATDNFIKDTEFFCGKAEEYDFGAMMPDAVVIDPPRKGVDEKLLSQLLKLAPTRIIYVSCNPATLARDLMRFFQMQEEAGVKYGIKKICPVDMFPQTTHVETVVLLSRLTGGV